MLASERLASLPLPVLRAIGAEVGPVEFASSDHRRFMESEAPEIVLSGWMGAGKSRALCEKAWWLANRYPGVTIGLFRKAAVDLPGSTERTWERDVIDHAKIAQHHKSEHWWQLTNGSRVYFLGLDPDPLTGVPSKIGSMDLGWAGVDEAVELTEGDWLLLLGRLRDPRMPWHQLAAATNPGPPKHWLRARVYGHPDRDWISVRKNRYLPADYLKMLTTLGDGAIGRRLGRGEWAAAEGAIWTLPDDQVKPPTAPAKRTVCGIDWGFVHAFAAEVVGQSGSGRLSVREEIYVRGAGVDQLVEPLAALAERHDVSAFVCDPSEPGLMAELSRGLVAHRGRHADCQLRAVVQPARNDVTPGLQAVDRQFREGMTVDPSCTGLLGEIPGYVWQSGRLGLTEKPVEINDDACDALRYAVMAFEADPDNPWGSLRSAGGVA